MSDNPTGAFYLYLLEPEIQFLEAAVEHLIPADELSPGARDAGVVVYIDRQLAGTWGVHGRQYRLGPWMEGTPQQGYQSRFTPQEVYRIAIREIDEHCRAARGRTFAQLPGADQLRLLQQLEKDEIALPSLSYSGSSCRCSGRGRKFMGRAACPTSRIWATAEESAASSEELNASTPAQLLLVPIETAAHRGRVVGPSDDDVAAHDLGTRRRGGFEVDGADDRLRAGDDLEDHRRAIRIVGDVDPWGDGRRHEPALVVQRLDHLPHVLGSSRQIGRAHV